MPSKLKRQKRRLAARQEMFDSMKSDSRQGCKRPGSMNPAKSFPSRPKRRR